MRYFFTYICIVFCLLESASAQTKLDSLIELAEDSNVYEASNDSIVYILDSTSGGYKASSNPDNYYSSDEYKPLEKKKVKLHEIDRSKWKQAKKGLRYDEDKPEEEDEDYSNFDFNMPQTSLFSGEGVKYFFIGLAILLIGIFLFYIFKNYISNKNVKQNQTVVSVDDIEDINAVQESELDRLLREALERKAYNEAIRIYYTFALKALSGKGFIHWKKDKTNREYLHEMQLNEHYALFNEVTIVFEYVWYGERPIGEAEYNSLVPKFKQLTENVKAVV